MNAILGPTGSGKSSLLDVLAGRKDKIGLSGHVLVDGDTQPVNFKCMSGYVIQDDIVMGMLTVRENIQFSAALRLPKTMSREKRNQRVEEVIYELGLNKCASTRVGTEFTRGISGGERKRTNIAMELITSPSVLFLDEPTTGLDSNTANSVMHLLQRLSRKGKTIIFSIHQPRYSIFKLFDSMMLLSQGECVYHGPASDALEHFENIGYVCEEHNNPSDFFLDILNGCLNPVCSTESDQYASEICPSTEKNIDGKLTVVFIPEAEDGSPDLSARQQSLVQHYQKSTWHQSLQTELSQIASDYEKIDKHDSAKRGRNLLYSTSFLTQLAILSSRTFRNMIRNPHGFVTQLFSAIILGLIVGTIYYQTDSTAQSGIQNRVGAFFFIVMNYVFGNMAAVDIFIKERSLFIHENVSGFYRVSAYFLAKLFFDVFPMRALPILLFASVTYWMIGLRSLFWWSFPFYLLNTIMTSLAGTSVALIFSASSRVHTIGTILTALVWTFMMVFSGLLVNVSTVPVWLQQLKYLSIFRYSMNSFLVNELKDAQFCDVPDVLHPNNTVCDYGNSYLMKQGIPFETTWDLWSNQVALLCLAVVFLIITYIQLRRIKKLH
ncbi:hypothetical protein NP493_262g02003 [Ridgeia piscesae]|uniref:ABC transporter domain-containing protein n=1 Tax=Ridgeia piscesae TaxID=27915 RepID=A0AAD9NXZ3_RIDPI|nr:hypothetical protein NP493_262g02003 [Ridgeia piscesae]